MFKYKWKIGMLCVFIFFWSCKKDSPPKKEYNYLKYEAVPSDTMKYYELRYWFKSVNAASYHQKGTFVYIDSIPKNSHTDSIYIQATGSDMDAQNMIRVSLKIYINGIVVKEIEGPISATPRLYQRIAYKL